MHGISFKAKHTFPNFNVNEDIATIFAFMKVMVSLKLLGSTQ